MFSLTIRGLWAHKLRYALTGLAVVLGVAFMAGTMVLTATMQKTFDGVVASANEGIDVIVRHDSSINGDFTDVRDRVDGSVVDRVAEVDGVAVAKGSITSQIQLVHADGTAAETDGLSATLGTNWIEDRRLNPFTLRSGHSPRGPDQAVVDQRTLDAEGWTVGDDISVLTKAGPAELTVVGSATYGDIEGLPGTTLIATDDATAQRLFAEPGRYDDVVVSAEPGVDARTLADRVTRQAAGPDSGLEVVTGAQDTADQQADFRKDLGFFNSFLMAFAYVALFVGTFIIYNTFSIVVAQRTKDLAMLRAIGARRGQVLRSVLFESVVVGTVAAAVGLAAGVGLSFGLRALLSGVGLEIPSGPVVVTAGTVVTAFVIGVGVSVLSAMAPAVRASRVKPIAALRDVATDRAGVSVKRAVAGVALTGGGVAAFAAGVVGDGSTLALIGLGALATVLGVFVLGPVLVRPAMRVLGGPVGRLSGITGRYAAENARRSPKRTAATASALMIGVALVGFITILASSTSSSVGAAVDRSFRADFVVDSGSWDRGFATSIEQDLARVPAVAEVSPVRMATAEVEGSAGEVLAVDTATIDDLFDLKVASGDLADVHGDGIAVQSDAATSKGLTLGDRVPFRFADGSTTQLTVVATYDGELAGAGDSPWLLGLDTFAAHVADQYDRQVYVSIHDGVGADEARRAIEHATSGWPNATIEDQAQFKESVTSDIDMMLNLIYGLLALAVVIALIGIANTLALSVHERTRELGVLRAIGMHRSQVRRAVRWESVLIAVLGAVLGATLAVAGAWGVVQALGSEGVTQFTVPVVRMAVIVAMAAVAGVLAATGPARRASRLNILEAIASE